MIIKCPNCGGALEYNIEQKNLFCKFCGSFYTPEEVEIPKEVKHFEVERLRGIYIPYWLFDADYKDSMVIASLEPYDYSGMCPFSPVYMSGFYADRFDIPADTMIMTSMDRAQKQMYEYARKSVPGSPSGYADTAPIECENIGRVD